MENERNERVLMRCDDIDIEEERIAKMGRLLAKANILQAFVNIALDHTKISTYGGDVLMDDDGRAVLLLISAFFEEEYNFRVAQLKAELEEKGDKA